MKTRRCILFEGFIRCVVDGWEYKSIAEEIGCSHSWVSGARDSGFSSKGKVVFKLISFLKAHKYLPASYSIDDDPPVPIVDVEAASGSFVVSPPAHAAVPSSFPVVAIAELSVLCKNLGNFLDAESIPIARRLDIAEKNAEAILEGIKALKGMV